MGSVRAHPEHDDADMRDLRRQAGTRPLSAGEEASLLQKSAGGDRTSQERLVAAHMGMVIRLAEARRDKGLSVPDLVQEGSIGLVEAVHIFAGSGERDFASFAEKKVGEQMDAALAAEAAAVREGEQLVAAASDYERTELLMRRQLGRKATEKEIAEKLEWTVDRTRYVAEVVAEARRRHDEELLEYIDPDAIDIDDTVDGE
jgi:DNA-directed RNA polymerase sigma subunit (sigma70/sigma32)